MKEFTIVITDSAIDKDEMADILEKIASKLREGFGVGYYPTWHLEEIENDPEN